MPKQIQSERHHQARTQEVVEEVATDTEVAAQTHHAEVDQAADDVLYLIDRALGELLVQAA